MNIYLPLLNATQMRRADQQTMRFVPGEVLMEKAGVRVADAILRCATDTSRVVLVAGPGNNGGDALAAARHLHRRHVPVTVVPLVASSDFSGDAATHLGYARDAGVKIRPAPQESGLDELSRWLLRASVVVDAIFGTGLSRRPAEHFAAAIRRINDSDRPILSVDIASGVNADDGSCPGEAIRARWTLPIAACKWGHWLGEGIRCRGHLLDPAPIGISDDCMRQAMTDDVAWLASRECLSSLLEARPIHAHKGDFGHVWIFGGSAGFSGAPQLAARGALAAGAGLVSIVCDEQIWPIVASSTPEFMVHPANKQSRQQAGRSADALVIGPGWGTHRADMLEELLHLQRPAVLDADALNILSEQAQLRSLLSGRESITVVTPHPGEAARLLGTTTEVVQCDRKKALRALVRSLNCWVVLKGRYTLLSSPEGDVVLVPFGGSKLATAGTGDVLAGVIASLLARMMRTGMVSPERIRQSIVAAIALHGQAGEQGFGYRASQLADQIACIRQRSENV